ncbi:unnamed protein product [Ostreobium quekettii]|uniref:Uncharacterized protein n=1 Tax=Ostreobium quekettii TaxID=121088 RepID=A0A8S1J344_9CHLO|nr:unnamed protein product [Ostreobium quekettii]
MCADKIPLLNDWAVLDITIQSVATHQTCCKDNLGLEHPHLIALPALPIWAVVDNSLESVTWRPDRRCQKLWMLAGSVPHGCSRCSLIFRHAVQQVGILLSSNVLAHICSKVCVHIKLLLSRNQLAIENSRATCFDGVLQTLFGGEARFLSWTG